MRFLKQLSTRSATLLLLCLGVVLLIAGRLFYLQVVGYDYYRSRVYGNILQTTPLAAARGEILDANGTVLATNITVYRVFLSPRDITSDAQAELIADGLSALLEVDKAFVLERAALRYHQDETIKRNVDSETGERVLAFIKEHQLSRQIYLEASEKRYYPLSSLASHVLGVVGTDGGLTGIEYSYNRYLCGTNGSYIYAKNALGQSLPYKYDGFVAAQDGATLVTTLDASLQAMLEKQVYEAYVDTDAQNRVTAVAMNVNTGGVLAMATYPNFDLNNPYTLDSVSAEKLNAYTGSNKRAYYNDLLFSLWNNKAVSDTYEPGSTFKILTCAMALEEGAVKTSDSFSCGGSATWGGRVIRCHKRTGHGSVSFGTGLQQSCNCALMSIADRLGQNTFYRYFTDFGLTEKTGIDLPSEAVSVYHPLSGFHTVELAVYSFGQTFRVTPLQQLSAICAVANGGTLVTPHIVSQIKDADGKILSEAETSIKRQVVSPEVCQTITQILEEGVSGNGGAKNAYVAGYQVAAKTGTSEVRDKLNANGESYLRIGSCVAYAPADNPQIAVILIVDEPQCQVKYGSVVAAPYVSAFLDEALPYLGFARDYTEAEVAKLGTVIENYQDLALSAAKSAIAKAGLSCKIVGTGDVVLRQIPSAGSVVEKEKGMVILYTEEKDVADTVVIPNVVGKTFHEANSILTNAGLNLRYTGAMNYDVGEAAVVTEQSLPADTEAPRGTVITITLRHLHDVDDRLETS